MTLALLSDPGVILLVSTLAGVLFGAGLFGR